MIVLDHQTTEEDEYVSQGNVTVSQNGASNFETSRYHPEIIHKFNNNVPSEKSPMPLLQITDEIAEPLTERPNTPKTNPWKLPT